MIINRTGGNYHSQEFILKRRESFTKRQKTHPQTFLYQKVAIIMCKLFKIFQSVILKSGLIYMS